jgi:hypothetical protein|nr:MAG TPA: hypothetical protein [Caudoviricetes sp.]
MISYNDNIKSGVLHITINVGIVHRFEFLNALTEMSKKILASGSEMVYISAPKDRIQLDRLGMAYFDNLLRMYVRRGKKIYVINWLAKLLNENVKGMKFETISIEETMQGSCANCFCFAKEADVSEAVEKIAEFIQEHSMVLSRDFLITTIGEIFSNAFNHSEEDKLYFMYDIEMKNGNYHLVINITDFGKTIVNSVKDYMAMKNNTHITSNECIKWAIQEGNTTRSTSGGYGLPTLIEYIKAVKGELLIMSGDSLYALKGVKENILESKGSFFGTSISLKIRLFDTSQVIDYDEEKKQLVSINLYEL